MQTKEKKWADVENYLLTLYDNNEELFYKMQDLKLTIDQKVTLTNVISENSRLTKKFQLVNKRLNKMRKRLLNPYFVEKQSTKDDFSYSDCETKAKKPRSYVEKLERALARSH